MTPCEICSCACERGLVPGKLGETVVCKSHGFSFRITVEGQCQLESVRDTNPEVVFQRAIGPNGPARQEGARRRPPSLHHKRVRLHDHDGVRRASRNRVVPAAIPP